MIRSGKAGIIFLVWIAMHFNGRMKTKEDRAKEDWAKEDRAKEDRAKEDAPPPHNKSAYYLQREVDQVPVRLFLGPQEASLRVKDRQSVTGAGHDLQELSSTD